MHRLMIFLQDRRIDLFVLLAFLLLILVQVKISAPPEWEDTWVVNALSSSAFENITSSILASIVAAYIFYVFIEVIPRGKALAETHLSLDNILASIVLSYVHTSRPHLNSNLDRQDVRILELSKLTEVVEETKIVALYNKILSAALHARDVEHVLDQGTIMASSISSKHTMFWIQICARSRELAELLDQMPHHDLFVASDVFRDAPDDYGQPERFRIYSIEMDHYRDRLRVKCWLLMFDILDWKKNYSVSKLVDDATL